MTASNTQTEPGLRDFLRELAGGGVVLSEPLVGLRGVESDDPTQVAFRTLIQLDGDICLSIHALALKSPDFAAAHARHLARVDDLLGRRTTKLHRSLKGISWATGLLGGGLVLASGSGAGGELAVALLPAAYADVGITFVAAAVALLMSRLGRSFARQLLRV